MKKTKRIAILALLLALTVILSLIPIQVSSATLALTLLPVFVLALTQDFVTGLLGGLVMGITSLVMAFTLNAGSPTAPIFQNPLVSIFPRVMVPAVAYLVMKGLSAVANRVNLRRYSSEVYRRIPSDGAEYKTECQAAAESSSSSPLSRTAKKRRAGGGVPGLAQAFIDGFACLCGVLTNTGLVLGMMWAIYGGQSVNDTLISPEFMSAMLSINFVIEVILFPLITPPVVRAVRKSNAR